MTTTTKSLEQKIEIAVVQLVREHLAACEAAAAVAMRAAFQRASSSSAKSSRSKSARACSPSPRRAPAPRRSREEMAVLEERLYEAIRRHPGETMAVIAPAVGATARELNQPAVRLRRQGRVRHVGQRQYTRYFPMGE
jgi:hypothetical protein